MLNAQAYMQVYMHSHMQKQIYVIIRMHIRTRDMAYQCT